MCTRLTRSAGLFVLAVAVVGCGESVRSGDRGAFKPSGQYQNGSGTEAPATDAGPAAIPTAEVDKKALDQYREYQRLYKRVYETGDPAPLGAVAMDPMLTTVTKDVEATRAKGEIWRIVTAVNPTVRGRSKDNRTVVVLDCLRTVAYYRYSATTGKLLNARKGGTKFYQVIMKYDSGTWKVSEAEGGGKC